MKRKKMDIVLGLSYGVGLLLIGIAATVYWGNGSNTVALWLLVGGVIWTILTGAAQTQQAISKAETGEPEIPRVEAIKARAYLSATSAQVLDFGTAVPTAAQITIKNTGQTPAYEVRVLASIGAWDFPPPGPFPPPTTTDASRFTVGAGQEIYMMPRTKIPLRQDAIDFIRQGRAAVYVDGEITYNDAFGGGHVSHFRFYYGGNQPLRADGAMHVSLDGNDSN